jgi:putative glycerol-1-phosphate prenyltransferase
MIETVSESIEIPLLVGGGIQNPEKVYLNAKAGADLIVVGNAVEKEASLLAEMVAALHSVSVREP